MTRLEKPIMAFIGLIIVIITTVTLLISITLCSNHNEKIFGDMAKTGVNVLQTNIDGFQDQLENTFRLWQTKGTASTALKKGFVGTLSELYTNADIDENTFCMFTDAEGNKVWSSNNYNLASYDVSACLDGKTVVKGYYSDANVPLSIIYITPVLYSDELLVGTCLLGYDLSSTEYLTSIKEQTNNDVTIFGGNIRIATTVTNANGVAETGTPMSDNVKQIVIDNGESYNSEAQILGTRYFVDYEPVVDIYGKVVGSLFSGQPTADSDAAFQNVIITVIIVAVIILIAAFIILAAFIKKVIIKPINQVNELAEHMSWGELSIADYNVSFGNNELGDFAKTLQNTKHSLSTYIADISSVLGKMADGDFTAKPSVQYIGDFKSISEAFEQISDKLSGIVKNINQSSEQVLLGSSQMANGAQVLANGTTTQASAIENLNNTVIEISKRIAINAENAVKAKKLSAGVESSAVKQNSDMNSVKAAMADIENKSSQISNIIMTIDDIAFQTNILALNAAVEAARAGDAGKGFAVVADEVRNLASKSAEAANLTTELISATVNAVSDGSELVDAAVKSMLEITQKTQETSRLIDEISTASSEQASSIQEVTNGLEKISEVVQLNSATAEETAASSEELSGQSQILRTQVELLKA